MAFDKPEFPLADSCPLCSHPVLEKTAKESRYFAQAADYLPAPDSLPDIHSDLDILLRHIRSAAAGLYALVLHGTEQNQEDQADLALLVHDLAREARRRAERLYHGGDLWRQRVEGEEPQSEESSPQ